MENELVKQLCAKQGFEHAASEIINKADIEAFSVLVEKSDFLFDFVKKNVIQRLQNCINKDNYKNLLNFLKIYSYDYEDLIVSNLKKYADENTKMLLKEKLLHGTLEEKTYCVKVFNEDKSVTGILREYSKSEYEPLAYNCASILGTLKDNESFNTAIQNLKSEDDFVVLSAVKFLSAYNDKSAIPYLFEALKKSSMAENIANEIIYMENIFELLKNHKDNTILLINHIINGLGEVIPLSVIFDIQLYELLEHIDEPLTLLLIKQKVEQLTENDEYLFDEDKSVKEEINAIKDLLYSKSIEYWESLCDMLSFENENHLLTLQLINELKLDYYSDDIKQLIENSNNPTVILKAVEVMKNFNKLSELNKDKILNKITDKTIREIIEHLFI